MQKTTINQPSGRVRLLATLTAITAVLVLAGCGSGLGRSLVATAGSALQGNVLGGQQPVVGASIQLYAATETGYGLASAALISATVITNSGGSFSITGDYTCPDALSQVYITATGGSAGSASTNANLTLMAPLGNCGNLNASTYITINELTTVASAFALRPFMSSPTQLSTTSTNLTGLRNAFATASKLVNSSTGRLPGSTLPSGAIEPVSELNTLADILASCVNSSGVSGSSGTCITLFENTTAPGGTVPRDTLTAALNIAANPDHNSSALYLLLPPSAPFQPTLPVAPTAYTISIHYAPVGVFSAPSASAVDSSGNVWVTNAGNNTITNVDAVTGAPTIYSAGGLNRPSAIAFDASGNAWVPNEGNSSLSVFTPAGVGDVVLASNLSSPTGIAIDGQGLIWVTNSGNNTTTSATPSGLNIIDSIAHATGGTTPVAIAINPH